MYNRYIPGTNGYSHVVDDPSRSGGQQATSGQRAGQTHPPSHGRRGSAGRPPFLGGEDKNAGIAGILKSLHLEDLDSGDVLLLLIILLVFLEGDNIEMVITLGLMLLLGLGEEKTHDQKE